MIYESCIAPPQGWPSFSFFLELSIIKNDVGFRSKRVETIVNLYMWK